MVGNPGNWKYYKNRYLMKWLWITIIQIIFTLVLYVLGIVILGLAIYPGAMVLLYAWNSTEPLELGLRTLLLCFSGVAGYFIFGFSLIFIVGILRYALRLRLEEGVYPAASLGTARWMLVNSLQLLISNTFMDFILLTPFANLVFRLLGAKLGKNVQINSKYCADISLLEVGDNSVIGGHSTVIGHSFERRGLVLKKVKIGRNVVIGLNSVILPGAEIGDNAVIAAGAVLQKNAKVEPRSMVIGVPAETPRERKAREKEE